ncbi:MAG TPA: hypothetical protein DIT28_02340 [Oxalobacteraceae bacterium]|nr:hypothetical protein [Oxalobacteraceae bacterium]HCN88003.1 hypothetical protein [Oxalobacteraceae bacterium]
MFYAAQGGGVSTYLNAKMRWLTRQSGIQHTIISPSVPSSNSALSVLSLPSFSLPGVPRYRFPQSVGAAAHLLRTLQPDLIEIGDAGPCAWAALKAKRALRVPVVATYHSDLPQLIESRFGSAVSQLARKYLVQLYRRCDMLLAPSNMMVQQLAMMGLPDAIHQPLGIDSTVFCPQHYDSTLREQLGIPRDSRLLIYAGRFTREKKLDVLIDAVSRLGPPYHLLLVGDGAVLPRTSQTTFIEFVRSARSLARLLASCDVLVHPGDCETFGLIVLEAMACGLPVVGTSAGGVAELVDDSTGILVTPNCAASLSEGIEAIFQNDLAVMGANARNKACSRYDWDRIMPQLLHRYASVLATPQRAELETELAFAAR